MRDGGLLCIVSICFSRFPFGGCITKQRRRHAGFLLWYRGKGTSRRASCQLNVPLGQCYFSLLPYQLWKCGFPWASTTILSSALKCTLESSPDRLGTFFDDFSGLNSISLYVATEKEGTSLTQQCLPLALKSVCSAPVPLSAIYIHTLKISTGPWDLSQNILCRLSELECSSGLKKLLLSYLGLKYMFF